MKKSKYRAFFSEEIVEKSPYPGVTAPGHSLQRRPRQRCRRRPRVRRPHLRLELCRSAPDRRAPAVRGRPRPVHPLRRQRSGRLGAAGGQGASPSRRREHRAPHHRAHPGLHTPRPDLRSRDLLGSRNPARLDELLHRPPILQSDGTAATTTFSSPRPASSAGPSTPGRPASGSLSPNRSGPSR